MRCTTLLLGTSALLLLSACSDPMTSENTSLVIEPGANAYTLLIGAEQQLTAYAVDARGRRGRAVAARWTSSDTTIARIDGEGKLRLASTYTACGWVTPGACRVEITAEAGTLKARQTLTILPYQAFLELNTQRIDLEIGYFEHVTASVLLELQPVPWCAVRYRAGDPNIISVDPLTGRVIALDLGKTTVDVEVTGPQCPGGVQVAVTTRMPLHVLSILPEESSFLPQGEARQLTAQVRNRKGVEYEAITVEWSSSNPEVATVDNGLVRARFCADATSGCRTTITARSGRLVAQTVIVVR